MGLDSKLLTFSNYIFNGLSLDGVTEYYLSRSLTEADLEEISGEVLLKAISTIKHFYCYIFRNRANNDKTEYQKSREKFRSYISRMCDDEEWFGKQTVFERCFTTISFVLTCSEYPEESFSNIKRKAYKSWTEYFKKYTKEFYNKGGWTELKKVANSYVMVHDFIRLFNPAPGALDLLIKTSKSAENYVYFCLIRVNILKAENESSKVIKKLKIEYANKRKTVASLWIKFIVQNVNAQDFDAYCIQPPKTTPEVTCLLRSLRNLCVGFRDEEKNRKEFYDFHKNSNSYEATGRESSKPIIKNTPLQNTVVCEDKDSSFENFTRGENVGTKNVSHISSVAGEVLSKSNEWKKVHRKGRYKVSDENVNFSEAMGEASSNLIVNNAPVQNTTVEEDREDGSIENFTGENNGNVPYTSSMDKAVLRKPKKRKRNRKLKRLKVLDKNSEPNEASSQASSNLIVNNAPVQIITVEKIVRMVVMTISLVKITVMYLILRQWISNVPYTSSMDKAVLRKPKKLKRNRKLKRLKVLDKNSAPNEASSQASLNSNFKNISLRNTADEKECGDKDNTESVAEG